MSDDLAKRLFVGARTLACLFLGIVKSDIRDMFSWEKTWGPFYNFLMEIAKDAPAAYRNLHRKIFRKEEVPSSPLKKGTQAAPGDAVYGALVLRAVIFGMMMGGISGALISSALTFWIVACIGGICFLMLPVMYYQMANFRLGFLGELVVGEELNKLASAHEWRVFHSVMLGDRKGDIDHILVCPKGLFCVETKTARYVVGGGKKIELDGDAIKIKGRPKNYKPVNQAKRNAARLHNFLKNKKEMRNEHGEMPRIPFIVPIVIYPGWFVQEESNDAEVYARNEAQIYVRNHDRIGDLLGRMPDEGGKCLSEDLMRKVCHVLENENRINIADRL